MGKVRIPGWGTPIKPPAMPKMPKFTPQERSKAMKAWNMGGLPAVARAFGVSVVTAKQFMTNPVKRAKIAAGIRGRKKK